MFSVSKPRPSRFISRAETTEDDAAIRIQSMFRGNQERKEFKRRGSGHRSKRRAEAAAAAASGSGHSPGGSGKPPALKTAWSSVSSKSKPTRKPTKRKLGSIWTKGAQQQKELPNRTFEEKIFLVLEDPGGVPPLSNVVHGTVMCTILLSVICFMLETMPELLFISSDVWDGIEVYCTLVFTVEYVGRLLMCNCAPDGRSRGRWAFLTSPMNVLDLLAIMPFYADLMLQQAGTVDVLKVLRMVRLIRLFRIFKLGRYSLGMQMMWEALQASAYALGVLGFFLMIAVILCSSILYYAEAMACPMRDAWTPAQLATYLEECEDPSAYEASTLGLCCDAYGAPAKFPSIIAGFWWAIVTMTTVGFGDVVPWTVLGRCVGIVSMLCGILLITLPVAIVGRKFQEVYERDKIEEEATEEDPYKVRLKAFKDAMLVAQKDPARAKASHDLKQLGEVAKPAVARRIKELQMLFEDGEDLHHRLERMKEVELFQQEEIHFQFHQLMDDVGYTLSRG